MSELETIHQHELQRRGGKCVRFPVSCLIKDMLQQVFGSLQLRILDVTYGQGRFWVAFRKHIKLLVGADPYMWEWKTVPDLFINTTVWRLWELLDELIRYSFDIVVVDPPFSTHHYNQRTRPMFNKIIGTPFIIIREAIRLAEQLFCKHVLIHWDRIWIPKGWKLELAYGFIYYCRYLKQRVFPKPRTTYFYIISSHFSEKCEGDSSECTT